MFPDIDSTLQAIFRWFHVLAGITWIGHLYFFNFVNVPFQGVLDKELKPKVNPPLILRALWWFRWGAMGTFLVGVLLFIMKYWMGGLMFDAEGNFSRRAMWILFGALLGTIMWFNVWFVIWPAQKKILGGMLAGTPAPPDVAKRALLFSRINTWLSGPMLVGMIAGSHMEDWTMMPNWMHGVFIILALGAIHGAIRSSYKVGQSI